MLKNITGSVFLSSSLTWQRSTAPSGSWRLTVKLGHPCFVNHRPNTSEQKKRKEKKSEVKAVYAELLSRYGMQVGRGRSSIAELADSGFYISTIRATLWLSSTMCSSDSCFSEILGLGKHVCYADSRTTNFTHLTSPPSVRRCTASRTRLLPVFCTSCWSASWFILTLFHRFMCVCVSLFCGQ